MGGDEDADGGLRLLGLDALGEVPEVALRHIGIREVLVRQARVACGELLGETMPHQENLLARKPPLGKQGLVGLVAHEAHELGRHERTARDVGKIAYGGGLVVIRDSVVPVVCHGEDQAALKGSGALETHLVAHRPGMCLGSLGAIVHLARMG